MNAPQRPFFLPVLVALLALGGCGGAGYSTYGAEVGFVDEPIYEEPC